MPINPKWEDVEVYESSYSPLQIQQSIADAFAARQIAQSVRDDANAGRFDGESGQPGQPGAVFTPAVDNDGNLTWSNNGGLLNPAAKNIRGPQGLPGTDGPPGPPGTAGKDFYVKGFYASVAALQAEISSPQPGDAYGVGQSEPYDIYIWDGVGMQWRNNGPIQGAKGDTGTAATVSVGTVSTLPYGQDAVVTNTGTANAAVLNFAIPQGKTPVKGVDYWTESDRQSIGASITPQMIGAVPEPESKQDGDVLKWNGSAWIAGDANENGVQSVNGSTGDVKTRLIFQNQTIAASAFTRQSNPTYPDFPYIGSKALSGVTADMIPEVIFSLPDAAGGNFAPVAETYSGGVYLYARNAPAGSTSIPVILMTV